MDRTFRTTLSAMLLGMAFLASPASGQEGVEVITGKLAVDGQLWKIATPSPLSKWNGTLILDLDAERGITPNTPFVRWLVANGYSYGGINRDKVTYRYDVGAERLIMVRQEFIKHYGIKPMRTIARGNSRGSNVARHALQLYPEIFDGGVVAMGGGAGLLSTMLLRLDSQFVLKTLVDPASPVKIISVPNTKAGIAAEEAALEDLVKKADSTPLGRARLALAAAVSQTGPWLLNKTPEPGARDWDAQYKQIPPIYADIQGVGIAAGATEIAGRNILWNNGVDYRAELSGSGRADFVRAMYAKTAGDGLKNLEADLRTLDKAPRISADPEAVNFAEKFLSYTGKVAGPVFAVNNIGDTNYPPSKEMAYAKTLAKAGNGALHRTAYVRSAAHGNINALELIVGLQILVDRLNTGKWHYTSEKEQSELARKIKSDSTVDLPDARFMAYQPDKALRTWDVSNHRTYRPSKN
jgi:pimeloyl-ACP methyl ester carboxylesterase